MPKKILKVREITIDEAKEILDKVDEEDLGEFQRRVFEFAQKFSKLSSKDAKKLIKKLTEDLELRMSEAIQIVNCMPETVEEIRSILAVKGRTFQTEFFKEVLKILNEYRKK